jgi:hypothetical protein
MILLKDMRVHVHMDVDSAANQLRDLFWHKQIPESRHAFSLF